MASGAAVADVGSGLLGLLRYGIALLLIAPLVFASTGERMAARDIVLVALLGIGQFGVLILLLNHALLLTSPSRAGLMFATQPFMALVLAMGLRHSVPGPATIAAILLTLAGIVCLLGFDALEGRLTVREFLGIGAAGLAALTGALCSVLYGSHLERYGVVRVSAVAMLASLPPLALFGLALPGGLPMADWPLRNFLLVLFIGLASGIALLGWFFALARLDATRATAFLALTPVSAAVLSVWLLNEPLTPGLVFSILLVSAGLIALARAQPIINARTGPYSSQ